MKNLMVKRIGKFMKNILISFILVLSLNINSQELPAIRPSCTKGILNVLVIGDSSSLREQTLDRLTDTLEARSKDSPDFGFFLNPLQDRVLAEDLHLDMDNFWNNVFLGIYENEELRFTQTRNLHSTAITRKEKSFEAILMLNLSTCGVMS